LTVGRKEPSRRPEHESSPDREVEKLKTKLGGLIGQYWLGWLYAHEWRIVDRYLTQFPILRETDPALFNLVHAAFADQARIHLARILDRGGFGIWKLLETVEKNEHIFRDDVRSEVAAGIVEDRRNLDALKKKIDNLARLRNKYFAHLDPKHLTSPEALFAKFEFTPDDADALYRCIGSILNRYRGCLVDDEFVMNEVGGEGKTDWLLSTLAEHIKARNAHPVDLPALLDKLYDLRDSGLEVRNIAPH
jgi:hypothetical protein